MGQFPTYDADFYKRQSAGSTNSALVILPILFRLLGSSPRAVLDVGCGIGNWLQEAKRLGVASVLGVDGAYVDQSQLLIDRCEFMAADVAKPLTLDRQFDLALCLEVGEHIPATASQILVQSLARATNVVLFSAAIPGQGGTHHVNEQWPQYWSNLFQQEGMVAFDVIRDAVWDDARVEEWYAQNCVVYARPNAENSSLPLFTSPHRCPYPLARVHPKMFEHVKRLLNDLRTQRDVPGVAWSVAGLRLALARSIQRRWGGITGKGMAK